MSKACSYCGGTGVYPETRTAGHARPDTCPECYGTGEEVPAVDLAKLAPVAKQKGVGEIILGIAGDVLPVVIDLFAGLLAGQNPIERLASERVDSILPPTLRLTLALRGETEETIAAKAKELHTAWKEGRK